MTDILFTRLGLIGVGALILLTFWLGRKIVVAWRDTNGNGEIDPGE